MRLEYRERFPRHRLQSKLLVSDHGMHHDTNVTHVPWCMSESLTRGGGETFSLLPAHAQSEMLRIWQEAHGASTTWQSFLTIAYTTVPPEIDSILQNYYYLPFVNNSSCLLALQSKVER